MMQVQDYIMVGSLLGGTPFFAWDQDFQPTYKGILIDDLPVQSLPSEWQETAVGGRGYLEDVEQAYREYQAGRRV